MPTHAQQARRRLTALGADVNDRSGRGELMLDAYLPAGLAWTASDCHALVISYKTDRDAGWTDLLNRIKLGTYDCTEPGCEHCGRPDPAAATVTTPAITVAISGKAMFAITRSELYQDRKAYTDPAGADHEAVLRAAAALQDAEPRQRGKGVQYIVTTDTQAAAVIAAFCQSTGERYATLPGPDDGRALLTAAERIRAAITAAAPADTDAAA